MGRILLPLSSICGIWIVAAKSYKLNGWVVHILESRLVEGGGTMASKYLDGSTKSAIRKWIKRVKRKDYKKGRTAGLRAEKKLKLSYKVLGIGNYRIVYEMDDGYVLKVATCKQGIVSNQIEKHIYKNSPQSVRYHLVKVKKGGKGWIIVEKAEKLPRETRYISKVAELKQKFEDVGIIADDIYEGRPNWGNLGIKAKEIVVVDYGKFKFHREKDAQ
ncbi:hypothetical protein [Paenibacillus silviterrae]|uniref:hypothetical protein n=1 Tax=Paenibacillus silviterrae TaxID=3242194 RepID=UPI0025439F09|nr:hypothetical protein [Paenibacillus chinjuensis]